MTIDAAMPGAIEKLSALEPDVIMLDLGTTRPDAVIALWKTRPDLLLIGVDLAADRMLILSGHPARALTAEDLIDALTTSLKGQIQ